MVSSTIDAPDRDVATEALAWPARAAAVTITDADSYAGACGLLLGIKDLRAKVAETFDPHIKRAHEAHKALLKEKQDAEAPLAIAERTIKGLITDYDREQERIRVEEQRRRDDEARRQAETETLERAAAMELEGQAYGDDALVAEAHAIVEAPVAPLPAVPVAKAVPKVAGVSLRKTWGFRIVDPSKVPDSYKVIDETKIRGVVRSLGPAANIPGVQVFETTQVAAGRR